MDSLFLISFFNIEINIENNGIGIKGARNNNFPIPMSTFLFFFMKDEKKNPIDFKFMQNACRFVKCLIDFLHLLRENVPFS